MVFQVTMYQQLPEQWLQGPYGEPRRTLRAKENESFNPVAGLSTTRLSQCTSYGRGGASMVQAQASNAGPYQMHSSWGQQYNMKEDTGPQIKDMENQSLHTVSYNNRFTNEDLEFILQQFRTHMKKSGKDTWQELHLTTWYATNTAIYSPAELWKVLHCFNLDLDPRTLRCLW